MVCFVAILLTNCRRRIVSSAAFWNSVSIQQGGSKIYSTGSKCERTVFQSSCFVPALQYRPTFSGRCYGTTSQDNGNDDIDNSNNIDSPDRRKAPNKAPRSNPKKFKVVEEISTANIDKLAAAFDELARKEGFDASLQHFADDATFEDYDDDDFDDDDDDLDIDDNDDLIFGADNPSDSDDMDARIAGARADMVTGRVSVPKALNRLAAQSLKTSAETRSLLGFRSFEGDDRYYGGVNEPPSSVRPPSPFQLVTDAMVCSACGADFQSSNENKPGYLPAEKFKVQVQLGQLEDLERLQSKAENDADDWSAEDEIEWLIQSASNSSSTISGTTAKSSDSATIDSAAEIDIQATAEGMGLDLEEITSRKKKVICKRCHGLQNFGKVENVLRPGWTQEPLLSQEKFRDLLRPIREKPAVIIALVDLFDFAGSVLPELDNIAGENPVILAANKADLLPAKMGQVRAESWVRRELEYMGIQSLANIGGSVRLVSCKTGAGISPMLAKARRLADKMDCDIYVVGAANAGKSTMLNQILGYELDNWEQMQQADVGKVRSGNRNKRKGAVTTSPLPGTTLKFIKVDLGGGRSLYDTPGLLVPGTLTQLLTPEELKIVVPKA